MINENIILRAQRGDTRAFQQIVEEYHGLLWRTVRILLRNPAQTEDILQEAWIDAWKGLPSLQNHLTLRSWLLTVASSRVDCQRGTVIQPFSDNPPSEPGMPLS